MNVRTIRLVEGKDWIEVLPLGGPAALVMGGSVFPEGDLFARPEEVSWDEAAERLGDSDTRISPFDLELFIDGVTQTILADESDQEAVDRAAASQGREDTFIMEEDLVRLIEEALRDGGRKESGHRRRKSDRVA